MDTCAKCNKELEIGDWPFCPHEKATPNIIGDECDIWIKHGLCNDDGSPKHYTSKEAIYKDAKAKGLVINPSGKPDRKRDAKRIYFLPK